MIPKKEFCHARIKYTAPLVTRDERNYNTDISTSVYFTEQPNIRPMAPTSSSYTLIKPSQGYNMKESVPMVYHPRPNHTTNENNAHPYYIFTDPRTTNKIENSGHTTPAQLPPVAKVETSQLLLKVSGPDVNTPGAAYIPTTHVTKQFPTAKKTQHMPVQQTSNNETVLPKNTNAYLTIDGEQRPQCPECFQTFKKRAALERHMMIHRGIKPFQCHFCNQRFRQKHHLQGHIMLHTGERPHSCSLCNKRFRMRHHLLEHERISHKVFR